MAKSKKENSQNNFFTLIFCVVVTFLLCYLCLGSSPRYLIHPSVDANAFFTVGKSMANGLTIYKDIFEQKGPFLYLIHCLSYKISNTSFLGVYIFEALALSFAVFFAFKIVNLYLDKRYGYFLSPVFLATILCSKCFEYGDTAEDFGFSMFMFSLYFLVKYFKEDKAIPVSVYFVSGLFAGCFAMMKFTMLGLYFGWMAVMALHTMLIKKELKQAFKLSFIFLGGMAITIAPWFIYFYIKGGLKEFIDVYFITNATAYGKVRMGIFERISAMLLSYRKNIANSPAFGFATFFGAVSFFVIGKFTNGKFLSRISVPIIFVCTCFFTYLGVTSYKYYILILADFLVFIYVAIGLLVSKVINPKIEKKAVTVLCILGIVGSLAYICNFNVTFKKAVTVKEKEQAPIYRITEYMQKHNPDGSVLCYDVLDNGVYFLGNYTPQFRFFELQNIPYENFPDNVDEQNRYINEGLADYVCASRFNSSEKHDTVDDIYERNGNLKTNYRLVSVYYYEPFDNTFYLFEKKVQ